MTKKCSVQCYWWPSSAVSMIDHRCRSLPSSWIDFSCSPKFSWACKALLKGNGHAKQEIKRHIEQEHHVDVKNGSSATYFRTFSTLVLRYLDDSWWWGWADILRIYSSSFLNDTAQAVFSPSDQAAWSWTMEHHNWLAICYICANWVCWFVHTLLCMATSYAGLHTEI
jgi:hypothetical protein